MPKFWEASGGTAAAAAAGGGGGLRLTAEGRRMREGVTVEVKIHNFKTCSKPPNHTPSAHQTVNTIAQQKVSLAHVPQ